VSKRKTIEGACLSWHEVLEFLDTLPPWQELCSQVESRCITFTDELRKVMAAAVGVCFHNYDFPNNLHRLFGMIGGEKAKPFRWHGHLSPPRWTMVNTVIVAIQGWLKEQSPVTLSRAYGVKQKDLNMLMDCLGAEQSHIKRAMLRRLLWNLIDGAVHATGLGIIGDCDEVSAKELTYLDFSEAYRWDDERNYFEFRAEDEPIRLLEEQIESFGQSGVGFLSYARTPRPSFCQQKTLRYQQIALYRIAHKWTDPTAKPPGGIPRSDYEQLYETYNDAVSKWYEQQRIPPSTTKPEVYRKVFDLLGEATECKRALLDCLISRSKPAQDLQEAAYVWLAERTRKALP